MSEDMLPKQPLSFPAALRQAATWEGAADETKGASISRRHVLRGIGWSFVQRWGGELANLVVFIVLVRLLPLTDFGRVAMASVFVNMLAVFVEQGLSSALIQRKDLETSHISAAFVISICAAWLLWVATILLAEPASRLMADHQLQWLLVGLAGTLVISPFTTTPRALLQRDIRFKEIALAGTAGALSAGILAIAAAIAGLGAWSLVIKQYVELLVTAAICIWFSGWRPSFSTSFKATQQLWRYSAYTLGVQILGTAKRQALPFLIGSYFGTANLGVFSVAAKVYYSALAVFSSVVSAVSFPLFARHQSQQIKLNQLLQQIVRYSAVVIVPAFASIIVLSPVIINQIFHVDSDVGVSLLRVLACLGIIHSFQGLVDSLLLAVARLRWRAITDAVQFAVVAAVFPVFAPQGMVAVVIAITMSAVMFLVLDCCLLQQAMKISAVAICVKLTSVFAGASAGAYLCWLVMASQVFPPLVRALFASAAMAVGFVVVIYFVDRRLITEFRALVAALRQAER